MCAGRDHEEAPLLGERRRAGCVQPLQPQPRPRRALGQERVDGADQHLEDPVRAPEDEGAVVSLRIERDRRVQQARRGVDDLARRAAQLLGERGADQRAPCPHQERVPQLGTQAREGVAGRRRCDSESPRGARDMRFFEEEVQRADVVQVERKSAWCQRWRVDTPLRSSSWTSSP